MALKLDVPIHSYKQLRGLADAFLAEYNPNSAIPVPIEEIAEFGLELNIIPIPGLQTSLEIDGFISSDFSSITVDQFVMEKRECRYRFTLAHEIAHLVLHRKIFEKLNVKTSAEWKTFQQEIDEEDHNWLEWQAYAFAGLVLVPAHPLISHLASCEQMVVRNGLKPNTEAAQWAICKALGAIFNVSREVIEKRLAKDKEE